MGHGKAWARRANSVRLLALLSGAVGSTVAYVTRPDAHAREILDSPAIPYLWVLFTLFILVVAVVSNIGRTVESVALLYLPLWCVIGAEIVRDPGDDGLAGVALIVPAVMAVASLLVAAPIARLVVNVKGGKTGNRL